MSSRCEIFSVTCLKNMVRSCIQPERRLPSHAFLADMPIVAMEALRRAQSTLTGVSRDRVVAGATGCNERVFVYRLRLGLSGGASAVSRMVRFPESYVFSNIFQHLSGRCTYSPTSFSIFQFLRRFKHLKFFLGTERC